MVSSGGILKSDRFRSQDRLELRLTQVHSLMVNVLLNNRIDQAGNITVVIDVLSNLCGADIFQLARQLQLHDFSPDLIVDLSRMCFSGPSEYDVIEEMDRIFFRLFLIGTCIVDDVRSDHDVKFLIREHFLQSAKVRRVRDIDRRVVREQMHIKFIRDRHVHDLTANQMRLGLLRPGKFVHREKYRKSEFTDLSGDLLVGQGERIEGPREECHFISRHGLHVTAEELVAGDETSDVRQGRRTVVEAELSAFILIQEEQQFFRTQREHPVLIALCKDLGAENMLPDHKKRLLADLFSVVCKAA